MRTNQLILAVLAAAVLVFAVIVIRKPPEKSAPSLVETDKNQPLSGSKGAVGSRSPSDNSNHAPALLTTHGGPGQNRAQAPAIEPADKAEKLMQIRDRFRALAAGSQVDALRQAKQITDETEREAALFTLVTEWTKGELRNPRERAAATSEFGLEASLGMELAKDPSLAMLWASELTDSEGRAAILKRVASEMMSNDPTAALALRDQLPKEEQKNFLDGVLGDWATRDTAAAISYADQLTDAVERDRSLQAIRAVAPVGIGAALRIQDGYPVINQLMPGTPAELSGQLHPGDRIVALAQGDNVFMDLHGVALADAVQLIRGAPNTLLQLQILPVGASPNSPPQTVSILRDQIKFKK